MKRTIASSLLIAFGLGLTVSTADEPKQHEMPQPTKEHEWLSRLEGEWTIKGHCSDPSGAKKPVEGTEKVELLGGFWSVGRVESKTGDQELSGVYTLGYDARSGEYISTWVDSVSGELYSARGSMDPSNRILTLQGEGYCPVQKKVIKFKDVIEIEDEEHRTYTAHHEVNGQMVPMLHLRYTKKAGATPQ